MDLCKTSLYNELVDSSEYLTMKQVLNYSRQVLECVQYVHNSNVVHRYIKSLNVLINGSNLLLCDFGVSRKLNETNQDTYMTYKCTMCFSSPESLDLIYEEKNRKIHGNSGFKNQFENYEIIQRKKCDIYSCGVLLWEIMTTFVTGSYRQPFNNFTMVTEGYSQKISNSFPIQFRQLVTRALEFNPRNRPGIDELLFELREIELIYESNVFQWENIVKDSKFVPGLVLQHSN